MNLALSLLALALGPLLYSACRNTDFARSALDGLLYASIAGLVIVHIVPDVYATAGFMSLVFLVAGIFIAFVVERLPEGGGQDRYGWIIALGALGLALHAMVDGIALLPGNHLADAIGHEGHSHGDIRNLGGADGHDHDHGHGSGLQGLLGNYLAIGVILHRIPVGMAIWSTVRPLFGTALAVAALALIAVATSAAYLLGQPVIDLMEARSVAFFQAFVAGSLLHVIVFTSARRHSPTPATAVGERLGVIVAIFILIMVPHAH